MSTITLGAIAVVIPAALASVAIACPDLADFLATPAVAYETHTLKTTLDGVAIDGERTATGVDLAMDLGRNFSISFYAEKCDDGEATFALTYTGQDGAVVDLIEKTARADGTVADLLVLPASLSSLSTLVLSYFEEDYDRKERRYNVGVDLDPAADATVA